jgi:uncharacterized membrane protein
VNPDDDALARSVANGFDLDVRDVLRRARAALPGSKRVVLVGAIAWLGTTWLVGALAFALGLGELVAASLGVLATTPLTLGLIMVGVRRARGEPVELADLVRYRGATAHGAIVLLVNLLVLNATEWALGPVASLPLGLTYALFAGFAPYLVADRGMDGFAAIATSFRLVRHRWGALLVLQLLLGALLAVAALPLGLGLIWAGPYAVAALGVAFDAAVPATLSTASKKTLSG